ncbi:MAG: hypothetical protein FWC43_12035 [Planctomycetaceae bacterium]|nr:hypothetical protein [Planctomycetaceae bacterium]
MSEQIAPLTYESVLSLIQKSSLEFRQWLEESSQKFDKRMEALAEQMKKTDEMSRRTEQKISDLGSRVGEIVENMVGGDIVEQFQALGYAVTALSRNIIFGMEGTKDEGEIDLLLEDGDIAILIGSRSRPNRVKSMKLVLFRSGKRSTL